MVPFFAHPVSNSSVTLWRQYTSIKTRRISRTRSGGHGVHCNADKTKPVITTLG